MNFDRIGPQRRNLPRRLEHHPTVFARQSVDEMNTNPNATVGQRPISTQKGFVVMSPPNPPGGFIVDGL